MSSSINCVWNNRNVKVYIYIKTQTLRQKLSLFAGVFSVSFFDSMSFAWVIYTKIAIEKLLQRTWIMSFECSFNILCKNFWIQNDLHYQLLALRAQLFAIFQHIFEFVVFVFAPIFFTICFSLCILANSIYVGMFILFKTSALIFLLYFLFILIFPSILWTCCLPLMFNNNIENKIKTMLSQYVEIFVWGSYL